jgi:hypothetical protein
MESIRGAIIVCGMSLPPDAARVANLTIAFDSSGRARTARVAPPFAGTATGDCMERAAERAVLPRFERASFEVRYPFRAR